MRIQLVLNSYEFGYGSFHSAARPKPFFGTKQPIEPRRITGMEYRLMNNRKSSHRVAIIATFFLFGFLFSQWNQTYRYAYDSERISIGPIVNYNEFLSDPFVEYQAAGFPLMHYLCICEEGFPDFVAFYWFPWFANIAIWLGLLTAALLYDRNIQRRWLNNGGRQLYVSDLLIITAVTAACLSAWRFAEARSKVELDLSQSISNDGGSMVRSLWLPQNAFGMITVNFNRTRAIQIVLKNSDDTLLRRTLELPRLTSLCLDGGTYDFQLLKCLAEKPFLRELRISNRVLTPDLIDCVREIKQLRSLNLMHTNITADDLRKLSDLPRLKYLNLVHTGIRLSEIALLPFRGTLHGIVVPLPDDGEPDQLEIDAWPRLQYFVCNSHRVPSGTAAVSIELKNLPKLEQVKIDCLQVMDLRLVNLPMVMSVGVIQSNEKSWSSFGGLRARHLVVNQVPKLKELKLHGPDLETIALHEPHLESLSILEDGFTPDLSVLARIRSQPQSQVRRAVSSINPTVFDGLASSVGPSRLEIVADLSNAPLDKIFKNNSINALDLSRAVYRFEQLKQPRLIQNMSEIWLGDNSLTGEDIAWLANQFTNATRLRYSGKIVGPLDLENEYSLISLECENTSQGSVYAGIGGLRLFHVAKLADQISVFGDLRFLYIDDAPSITGLTFHRPIPKGSVIKGLRDLTQFRASGKHLTDEVISAVLECPNLTSLEIQDSSVSNAMFCKIASLERLSRLVVGGSQLDESALRAFALSPSLKYLQLSKIKLDEKSIAALTSAPAIALKSLHLDHCEVEIELILKLAESLHITMDSSMQEELKSVTIGREFNFGPQLGR